MSLNQENDFKPQYKTMKRKLKILIYENECFQEELRKAQRSLLRIQRDKSFLLDRIMQYQQGPESSSDSEQTDESDNENFVKDNKRKKTSSDHSSSFVLNLQGGTKGPSVKKKKTSHNSLGSPVIVTKNIGTQRQIGKQSSLSGIHHSSNTSSKSSSSQRLKGHMPTNQTASNSGVSTSTGIITNANSSSMSDVQMSREEIERQLAARQPITDFSTTVSLTLPNQLFSDNLMEGDFIEEDTETSPSNIEDEVTVDSYD